MRILHVIDVLDGGGSALQLRLLAPALAASGCTVEICCLGAATPAVAELRRAGVPVRVLGWTRWLDATAWTELRTQLRSAGDVVHVWRLAALRAVAMVGREVLPRAVVSAPLPTTVRPGWWDRGLLRRVRCVALTGEGERLRCVAAGLGDVRWQAVPRAAPASPDAPVPAWLARYPRRIACAGPLERGRGFREAIWAADVLHHIFPDLHLFIVGSGPRRPDLEALIAGGAMRNVHLLGDTVEADAVLAAADVCWVPSRRDCGQHAALAALATGRPVVASDVPCLRELIRDDATGCLVPPGDPVALARRTAALLRDPERAGRLGNAGHADARARFALANVAARWRGLYNDFAA